MRYQTKSPRAALAALLAFAFGPAFTAHASSPPELMVPATADLSAFKTEKNPVLSLADSDGAKVLKVEFPADSGYPGINLPIPGGSWDLSAYEGIAVEVTNASQTRVNLAARVDNPGDWKKSPWNTNNIWLSPGESKVLKVTFGESFGRPAYALDPSKVKGIKFFVEKPKQPVTVLIKSVRAIGTATAKLAANASAPSAQASTLNSQLSALSSQPSAGTSQPSTLNSQLFTPTADSLAAIKTEKNPVLSVDTSTGAPALKVEFPGGSGYPGLNFPLPSGRLDLSGFAGVEVDVTNVSQERLGINLRVDNPGDWKKSPWNTSNTWIAPGETKTVKVTFGESYGKPGYALDPSKVSVIKLFAANPKQTSAVLVKNLRPFGTGQVGAGSPAMASTAATPPPSAVRPPSSGSSPAAGAPAAGPVLFDPANATDVSSFKTGENTQVSLVSAGGAQVLQAIFPATKGYPSFDFAKPAGGWNLSAFAGVEAEVTNAGDTPVTVALRIDNPGHWKNEPWNVEQTKIAPGATGKIRVNFGESYGRSGYAIDPSKVTTVKVYTANPTKGATIHVKRLSGVGTGGQATAHAAASTASAPAASADAGADSTFSPPIEGYLLELKGANPLAGFKYSHTTATVEGGKIKAVFTPGTHYPNIQFPVPKGGWKLSAFGGVEVTITNPNEQKVTAHLRVDNPGHWKNEPWNTHKLTVGPGQTKTLQLIFGEQNGAPAFPLNPARVSAIQLFLIKPKQDTTLVLSDLKAWGSPADAANQLSFSKPEDRNVPAVLPDWLGKRPPVEGAWIVTLDENFDGNALNEERWTRRFPWDGPMPGQLQRYAPENVVVENGIARFKVEKKHGHENNDPNLKARNYTSGLIQSYDKWTQLYGYIEARIKVPYVNGLWPAFWLMPDRGSNSGLDAWRRRSTTKGAMEIDIMEILSEWGPGRSSVATHWDGYEANHKQWGTSQIYYGPTPDGYHVFGLLWEPGKLTWYIDGQKKAEQITDRVSNVPSYLKLNVQMGGWATKNVEDAKLPATMDVDYVRAWQLKSRM